VSPPQQESRHQEGSLLAQALRLAAQGWFLLPLAPGSKQPMLKGWPKRASCDPAQIQRWWQAQPRANIGVACGPSGLVVIDLDVKNGARGPEAWEALCAELGLSPWDTAAAATPSGGRHLYYAAPKDTPLRSSAGKLGPGIDVRAAGGYVVAPPSRTAEGSYAWIEPGPLRPLPAPVARCLATQRPVGERPAGQRPPPRPGPDVSPSGADAALAAYVRKAVDAEAHNVAHAPEGMRNHTLNVAAYCLGQLVAAPWAGLAKDAVRDTLLRAARACGLPEREALATIDSGLAVGMQHPRPSPHRDRSAGPSGPAGDRSAPPSDKAEPPRRKDGSTGYTDALAALGYAFQMNVCNDRILVNGAPLTDVLAAKIRTQMRDLGFTHMSALEDAYTAQAYDHPWHPVRDYLDRLRWDGADAIDALASHFQDERRVLSLFLRRWLIGAVAKAYQAAQNRMLILDGAQQLGKSHFVRWLCSPLPALLVEGPINPEIKDDQLRLISRWIWEVAELGATTRKADRESLKHFLTVRQVTVRQPYGRYDIVKPALASFIGTINNEAGILSDPTGSRRFMAVHLRKIDWHYTAIDVDQVWAQAVALYRAGEPWELLGEDAGLAQCANEEYEVDDPLEGYIRRCYTITHDPHDRVLTCDILDRLHGTGWIGQHTRRGESMELSPLLRKLGLKPFRSARGRGWQGIAPRHPGR
jgi:hypothetical protein